MISLTLALIAMIFGWICIICIGLGAVVALILGIIKIIKEIFFDDDF